MRTLASVVLGLLVWCAQARAADTAIARGEYLTRAADCAACHLGAGDALSGGRAFATPFGTIYAPNITPDKETGIGGYTDDEWLSALQRGVARGGKHLYPAMPYTNYTLMTREDALDIKAYLMTQPPVHAPTPENRMRFPFNIRLLMVFWNLLNNPDHRFQPDPAHDAVWNRGAYLAEALGHCQQCHTPRGLLQGLDTSRAYAGAITQGWKAYNLTSDPESGIGAWSEQDVAAYVSTGHAEGHGVAGGPMAEAVSYSLRYLTHDDVTALATYLKTIPPIHEAPPSVSGAVAEDELDHRIFEGACASCHRLDGAGRQTPYAALLGDQSVRDPQGTNVVQMVLGGGSIATRDGTLFMPAFAMGYTDAELAAVANYAIEHFGHVSGQVTPADIAKARGPGQRPQVPSS